jgi:hypothetical protein
VRHLHRGLGAKRLAGRGPDGKRTEPTPWLADYGLAECPEPGLPARTKANVRDSDATLWIGDWHTHGGRATLDACRIQDKPFMLLFRGATRPSQVCDWLGTKGVRVLNVAGNRESVDRGIGERVGRFLIRVFRQLGRGVE